VQGRPPPRQVHGGANVNSLTIKEVGKQCPNLTYLDLNCSKNLDVADEDVIIEAVRGMKQLQTLRLAPFGPFNTFIGDWRFVKGHLVYNTPEMEYESQQWEIDMDDHDYCDGSESDVDMLGSTKLRELQSLLPRNCKLTNNGKWAGSGFINESWGTAFDEHAAEWNVFGGRSYKQMGSLSYTEQANGSDGSTLRKGHVKTVWLQCGDAKEAAADGRAAKRFYQCANDWHAANPVIEKLKPLGPVIET